MPELGNCGRRSPLLARRHFEVRESNLGASRVTDGAGDTTIEVRTLNSFADELPLNEVTFVKIDVEGHEDKVITGALEFLCTAKPIIAPEGWYATDPRKGDRVSALLDGVGYRHYFALTDRPPSRSRTLHACLPKPMRRKRPLRLERIDTLNWANHDIAIASMTNFLGD